MGNRSSQDKEPTELGNVNPTDLGAAAGQTRLIVDAVKESVAELKSDVKEIRAYRFSDLFWHIGITGTAFLIICGMMIAVYFKIEDRLQALSTSMTKVETKLDDLLQRIPPVPTPPPAAPTKR